MNREDVFSKLGELQYAAPDDGFATWRGAIEGLVDVLCDPQSGLGEDHRTTLMECGAIMLRQALREAASDLGQIATPQ